MVDARSWRFFRFFKSAVSQHTHVPDSHRLVPRRGDQTVRRVSVAPSPPSRRRRDHRVVVRAEPRNGARLFGPETTPRALRRSAQTRARAVVTPRRALRGSTRRRYRPRRRGFPGSAEPRAGDALARHVHEADASILRPRDEPTRASGVGARHESRRPEPSLGGHRGRREGHAFVRRASPLGPSPNTSSPMISPSSGPLRNAPRSASEDAEVRGAARSVGGISFRTRVALRARRAARARDASAAASRSRRRCRRRKRAILSSRHRPRPRPRRACGPLERRRSASGLSMARALRSQPANAASRDFREAKSAAEGSLGSPSRG